MKTQFARIKNRAKGVSTRTLAVMLCFVMLLTAIGSGSVLSAIAAGTSDDGSTAVADAAQKFADIAASVDTGAEQETDAESAFLPKISDQLAVAEADDAETPAESKPAKKNTDLAETGAADVYAVAGSWDNWKKHYFDGATGSATVNVTLSGSSTYYFKIYSNYGTTAWYGDDHTFSATTNEYYLKTGKGNATISTGYTGTYVFTLKREDQNDGSVAMGLTFPTTQSTTSAGDMVIFGDFNSGVDWNNAGSRKMTYMWDDGTNYYYKYTLDTSQIQYFNFYYPNTRTYWKTSSTDSNYTNNVMVNSGFSNKRTAQKSGYTCFYIDKPSTPKILWVRYCYKGTNADNQVKVWVSDTSFYLTGYLNGKDTPDQTAYTTYPFTETNTSGVYTCTFSSETAAQYVTIYDGTDAYHPETHKSGTGTAADPSKMDNNPSGNGYNKWMVSSALGKSITFTWNSNTDVLSWTFGSSNAVIYAKDGCAPINWDRKNNAGATSLDGYNSSKYYYNFARIADTAVTSSDGTSFSSVDCDIESSTSGSTYETASVEAGSTLTITTTIEDKKDHKDNATTGTSWRDKYYVVGWCINGVTYSGNNSNSVNTTVNSSGVYTMYYTVPEDVEAGTIIEITPIYYFADSSNTITFYLEGFDAVKGNGTTATDWGDTPYVYPFYGSLYGHQSCFGVYPGQPFVYVDGKYSTQIPITSNAIYDNTNDGTTIKGITVSNGYADHVHRNLKYTTWQTLGPGGTGDDQYHMQTYDYDDFYKIYNEKRDSSGNKPSSIILRMKNETTRNNRNTYGGDSSGHYWAYDTHNGNPYPVDSLTSANVLDVETSGNGWELLTDRYGRPVDLFGNVIGTAYNASTEASKTAIRVISSGYNENIAGDYGTSWIVYTPDSNTCTANSGVYTCSSYTLMKDTTKNRYAIPPSIFLLSSTSSFNTTTYKDATHTVDNYPYTDSVNNYKTMYTTLKTSGDSGTNALGRYVYITYEKNAQRKGNNYSQSSPTTTDYGAKRMDARWFYTYATDMVSANIKIQYENSGSFVDEASYVTGYNSKANQGNHTGCKAYFTNTAFDGEVNSGDVLINSGNFEFTAVTAAGWKFDGWYIEYDNGASYTPLSTAISASTPMSASDTIVARFEPITNGYLNISHTIGTDATHTGTGEAALRVRVYADDTKASLIYDTGSTTNDVLLDGNYISNTLGDYYIDVTLMTTPSGDDTFASFSYDTFNTTKSITATENTSATPKTSNFGFKVDSLFTSSTQNYRSLSYVSYLTAVSHAYNITYKFAPRGVQDSETAKLKTYTVKGTFTSKEYAAYVDSSVAVASRTVADAFIKSKAPFESNFMKTMTLNYSGATQSCTTVDNVITHTVTIDFTTADSKSLYAIFDLPYEYYTAADSEANPPVKKYTAMTDSTTNNVLKNDNTVTFEIDTNYLEYFTSTGTQENVEKDVTTVNHTDNDFITAPKIIYDKDSNKYLYFNYWQIYKTDRTTKIARVYYEDFHYLAYGNYYVKPVYVEQDDLIAYTSAGLSASVTYLGDSRNQWNTNDSAAHSGTGSQSYAADLIYNDLAFAFGSDNELVSSLGDDVEIGVIIERIDGSDSGASTSISNMDVYKTMYSDSESISKTAVENFVSGSNSTLGLIATRQVLSKTDLNNKNRMEKYFSFYSQYGQNDDLTFYTNSAVDNYVYRAWAYIKNGSSVAVSDPAYFSMKYTANISAYTGN